MQNVENDSMIFYIVKPVQFKLNLLKYAEDSMAEDCRRMFYDSRSRQHNGYDAMHSYKISK